MSWRIKRFSAWPRSNFAFCWENSPLIKKKEQPPPINTVRATIQPDERLAVTLRYLATRGTYHSLEYSIRISRQTISSIVSDTSRGLQLQTLLLRPLRPPCFFLICRVAALRWQPITSVEVKFVARQVEASVVIRATELKFVAESRTRVYFSQHVASTCNIVFCCETSWPRRW